MLIHVRSELVDIVEHIQTKVPRVIVAYEPSGYGALLMPPLEPKPEIPVHVSIVGDDLHLGGKSGPDPFFDEVSDAIDDFMGHGGQLIRDYGVNL